MQKYQSCLFLSLLCTSLCKYEKAKKELKELYDLKGKEAILRSKARWVEQREKSKVSRGVRQGCPLSSFLFILAVEILTRKMRQDLNCKGIMLPNSQEVKLAQFGDDTTLISDNTILGDPGADSRGERQIKRAKSVQAKIIASNTLTPPPPPPIRGHERNWEKN